MGFLKEKPPRIDYVKHFFAGGLITLLLSLIDPFFGLVTGFAVGVLKEYVWDKWLDRGCFEWTDMAYTITGSTLVYIIIMLCI
jgi:ABC-type dipeptide/oligopeptide/nickel transport system permease subunit